MPEKAISSSLHECRIKVACMFGANIPTAHTTYAKFLIGVTGIAFVDCADWTTVSTNSAGGTIVVSFRLERNVRVFLICPMPSDKVQRTEYTAFKLDSDLAGKLCQLFGIVCARTPGCKLPEDGVFGNSGNRSHADKTAIFKRILKFGQGVIPLPIAINTIQDRFRPITGNLFDPFNSNRWNSPRK